MTVQFIKQLKQETDNLRTWITEIKTTVWLSQYSPHPY